MEHNARQMASIEYAALVGQLQCLVGRHVDKFVHFGAKSFRLKIGDMDIAIDAPLRANATKYILDSPKVPTDFGLQMKKRVEGAKVAQVEQHECDRVFYFGLEKGAEKFYLIFEMFSGGNCILADSEWKTVIALAYEDWKGRCIRPKQPYEFPKATITRQGMEDVESAMEQVLSGKYVSACLAKLPIGTAYTNEALSRCGIDEKAKELSLSQKKELAREIAKIISEKSPMAFLDGSGNVVDFALAAIGKYASLKHAAFDDFSQAADEYYRQHPIKLEQEDAEGKKALEKLLVMAQKQKEAITHLEGLEKEHLEAGKRITESLELAQSCIDFAKSGSIAQGGRAKEIDGMVESGALKVERKKAELEIEL